MQEVIELLVPLTYTDYDMNGKYDTNVAFGSPLPSLCDNLALPFSNLFCEDSRMERQKKATQ